MTLTVRAALVAVLLAPPPAKADAKTDFFEYKIRPALVEHCLKCHSADAEKSNKLRGGLRLDTKAGWQKGGDTGAAIVPGKPGEGTLLKSLKYDGDVQMPPKGKLPPAVIADFQTWITDGAADPREEKAVAKAPAGIDIEKGRTFWSLVPLKAPPIPPVSRDAQRSVGATAIDAFVAAEWDKRKLTPAAPADTRTLARRAYFDLIGLPPTPDELEAFVTDTSADAFAKLIDKLLASPHYGERWGRHWLDVARYAEDQAHTFGVKPKAQAFRYRD